MLIKKPSDIRASEITDERLYLRRREFIQVGVAAALGLAASACEMKASSSSRAPVPQNLARLEAARNTAFSTNETKTPYEDITTYNNFYEFGTDKSDPSTYAGSLRPKPWTVKVDGEVGKPGNYHVDDLVKPSALEERIYRLRCVEGWSMVIPWIGFPLGEVIKRFEPTAKAKFVEFTTLYDPGQMPGQKSNVLQWPYVEGLRLDEAMHPLAILCVGLYGRVLPNQDGAPIRLVVPWKYGFKSIKSIVRIKLVEKQPSTTWALSAPREYGFYSNVNPQVDHPRWSQATERRIGEFSKRKTLMFNGYGDQVASLYSGMDLRKYF